MRNLMPLSARQLEILSFSLTIALISVLGLITLDSIGNPESSNKFIGISSITLVIPYILLQLGARLLSGVRLPQFFSKLLYLPLAVLIPLAAGLSIFWANSHENAVFELTKLHPEGLTLLIILISLALLINQSKKWWQSNWPKVVLILPAAVFLILYMVSLWHFNIFKEIVKEDQIIEYGQFWVLIGGGIINLLAAKKFLKQKNWLFASFCVIAGVGFMAVAGDEIAWGQRLLGIESSENVMEINRQGEITFHNLYAVEWLVIYGYTALSFFGVAANWIAKAIKPLRKFQPLLPNNILIGYFLLPLVFFVQQLRVTGGTWQSWSEVAELYLYAGIVFWTIMIYRNK